MHCFHSPPPPSASTFLLLRPPQTPQICQNLHPYLLLLLLSPLSIQLHLFLCASPRLSLHLVTCVSHSWPTCCFTQTHIGTYATYTPVSQTCQSTRERDGERKTSSLFPNIFSIFNLKLKSEECLSPGVSRTNNWQLD
ncbi:hypothetical protein E3U43_013546 [Larimichthys crocea]|uniref:Uncharacterized protein n=1 Tax=Larimichthys crocea TaxID=215358 RepID=A0ACD3RC70_LARCR|nr:hypothetical protein E3U43_013546 [Larimichthys crocea]